MHLSQLQYLPLSLPFFSILAAAFLILVALLQIGVLTYAYMRIGLSVSATLLLLLGSLVGSYFNFGVAQLPGEQVMSGREISFYGMHYVAPIVVDWPGTIIAVNVGGALIPTFVSLYLIFKNSLWVESLVTVVIVAAICHAYAHPVPGLGIAVPQFVPSVSAAGAALLLFRRKAAPLAYVSGAMGTLIGADLLNLGKIAGLHAPVASIGGAGTFDGIFLSGILAVLIASLFVRPDEVGPDRPEAQASPPKNPWA